ncbi:MAG: hypothetical protein A4S14_13390 [Proteobacteria bacterium SG_bin9]|nr:MAG: hypothetical protein A4S14_13390 [Proteobacteria bacterium SG_bin9]
MNRNSKLVVTCMIVIAYAALASAALASQGPGTGPGPVSGPVQTIMAVLVYGFCGATVLMAAVIDLWK